jgi:hypothetical protein
MIEQSNLSSVLKHSIQYGEGNQVLANQPFLRNLLVAGSVFASVPMVLVSGTDPQWSEWS